MINPLHAATDGLLLDGGRTSLGIASRGLLAPEIAPAAGGGIVAGRRTQKLPSYDELQRDRYYQQALAEDEEILAIIIAAVTNNLI